jgi:hypothetical protein
MLTMRALSVDVIPNARVFHRGGWISAFTAVERQPMDPALKQSKGISHAP